MTQLWHTLTITEVVEQLTSDDQNGLTAASAAERLATHGPNELIDKGGKSPWLLLWEQVSNMMVLILIAAVVISALFAQKTLVSCPGLDERAIDTEVFA